MPTYVELGGPSPSERQMVYTLMSLEERDAQSVEAMILESGRRDVARAALTNVRVRLNSLKNRSARVVESHTCELVHAYELEFDPEVLGYFVQVPCRRVERKTAHGRLHISTAHLDFLVFRRLHVEVVECKQRRWLEKRCETDVEWKNSNDGWSYGPYAEWARAHGLRFSVWVAPDPPGIYLQNLEACYALKDHVLARLDQVIVRDACAIIRKSPISIHDLSSEVRGFDIRLALWMLANNHAFGPWKSTPIALVERFNLYADKPQSQLADTILLQKTALNNVQPSYEDPLLSASVTDVAKARQRLARLISIESGAIPNTRRMQALALKVRKAVSEGNSPISACVTHYSKSGNRQSRLLPEQETAIENVISKYWHTGKARRPQDLVHALEDECEKLGVPRCGRSRVDLRRRQEGSVRHSLATGGLRAYHASRPSTDPRTRSLTPLGYGQVLHIDSSDLDVRCAPNILQMLPAAKAKFYIALDGATGDTMAHAFLFGPARTDGLALLFRELVKRHKMLPQMIHVDRGSENTSKWLERFCEGRISLRHSPTAASPWNGMAENCIKQVNDQVAHQLIGSTRPDQMGRKVDGRFKSYRNAKMEFSVVVEQFAAFVYGDLPVTPRGDGQSPIEKREYAEKTYGNMGTPCEWNDDFIIQTSVPIASLKRADSRRGIRTAEGWYSSQELLALMRTKSPQEIRLDSCDPTVMYVLIAERWLKAFHSRVQSIALYTESEKLFELLWAPLARAEARIKRDQIARLRYSRIQQSLIAHPATQHLAPSNALDNEGLLALDSELGSVSYLDLTPFDEQEQF